MKFIVFAVLALLIPSVHAQTGPAAVPKSDIVCSYAPSQSKAVAAVSGAAGGAGATIGAMAAATGLTVVTHSSGALILTGSAGYIAGTIGAAAAAPFIVGVGLVVGSAAVTIELVCAWKNHPDQVAKVDKAATEFSRRFSESMKKTTVAAADLKKAIAPAAGRATAEVKRIAGDVLKYANRASAEARNLFPK